MAHIAVLEDDPAALLKYTLKDAITEMSSEMCFELGDYYFGKKDIDEAIVSTTMQPMNAAAFLILKRAEVSRALHLPSATTSLATRSRQEITREKLQKLKKT